jgi:hypothetical protein
VRGLGWSAETYEGNHASYQLCYTGQAARSDDFVVGELCAEGEIAKSKQLDVLVVLIIALRWDVSSVTQKRSGVWAPSIMASMWRPQLQRCINLHTCAAIFDRS